jgi:micrococcal nuclease
MAGLLTLSPACAQSPRLEASLLKVYDGDSLQLRLQSGVIEVRLHGVDSPEYDQRGGREAQRWLRQRLKGSRLTLEPISQDRYQRMVAILYVDRVQINRELVAQGHAWAYRQFLRTEDLELCELEQQARRAKRGLWAPRMLPAHAPWQHRSTKGRGPFTEQACGT